MLELCQIGIVFGGSVDVRFTLIHSQFEWWCCSWTEYAVSVLLSYRCLINCANITDFECSITIFDEMLRTPNHAIDEVLLCISHCECDDTGIRAVVTRLMNLFLTLCNDQTSNEEWMRIHCQVFDLHEIAGHFGWWLVKMEKSFFI